MDSEDTPTFALLNSPELKGYDFGIGHPFRGDRFRLFSSLIADIFAPDGRYETIDTDPASLEELLLIHDEEYIAFTAEYFGTGNLGNGILDRFATYHSGDNYPPSRPIKVESAARQVVGQARAACDLVIDGAYQKAVAIGGGLHHAKRDFGEGFCIYNDVAFCGKWLTKKRGLDRVLILDTDAHAGNGTAQYFFSDPRVLFIDIHQDPASIYPGAGFVEQVGIDEGEGYTVNIPLPPGAGDRSFELAFESVILPVAREFNPQIVIQNGGSDPHSFDTLTNLNLSLNGFLKMGQNVATMAEQCDNRLIGLVTSGYSMDILPYAWLSLICGLTGNTVAFPNDPESGFQAPDDVCDQTLEVIQEIRNVHKNTWKCLR